MIGIETLKSNPNLFEDFTHALDKLIRTHNFHFLEERRRTAEVHVKITSSGSTHIHYLLYFTVKDGVVAEKADVFIINFLKLIMKTYKKVRVENVKFLSMEHHRERKGHFHLYIYYYTLWIKIQVLIKFKTVFHSYAK